MGSIESFVQQHDYEGRMLGGIYRLETFVGQGGFGEVWRAVAQKSGTPVAVKLLPPGVSRSPETLATLQHECRMLKTLVHPNICRFLDLIVDDQLGVALVTEFVEGKDIYKATASGDCEPYLIQLLQALSYLHSKEVLHLDIKPDNCLVMDGQVKLIDFGLATVLPPTQMAGTPTYMSPEMILDETRKDIDGRADLYSAGVLWYYCLTRENPFYSANPKDVEDNHLRLTPPPPSEKLTKGVVVPDYTDRIVMKLLAKRPSERFTSANHVLKGLEVATGKAIPMSGGIASAFAGACGEFIGRKDILGKLSAWLGSAAQTPTVTWLAVNGERGVGRTRLLYESKFIAQLGGCQTIYLDSVDKVTPEVLAPLSDALAAHHAPVVVLLDNYDQWMKDVDAAPLQNLLDTLRQHPHPPTSIYCMMATGRGKAIPQQVEHVRLPPFSAEEVGTFLDAVASPPPTQRQTLVDQLMKLTGGNPSLLTLVVTEIVRRGQMVSQFGKWDASLFEDISIDIPERSPERAPQSSPSPGALLKQSREERQTGHALRALERILHYPELTEELLVEAAECALTIGKTQEVLDLMSRFPVNAQLLLWKAILLMVNRDCNAARPALMEGLALAQKAEDEVLGLRLSNQLARLEMLQKKHDLAIAIFEKNREHEKHLAKEAASTILNNELGHALFLNNQYSKAIPVLDEDIQKFKMSGHDRRLLRTYLWRGNCQKAMGNLELARGDYETIVKLAKAVQDLMVLLEAYNGLAITHVMNSEIDEAIAMYERALSLAYCLNDLDNAAKIITNIGLEHSKRGDCVSAKHAFELTLSFLNHKKIKTITHHVIVPALIGLAEVARQEKLFQKSRQYLKEAQTFAADYNILAQYQEDISVTLAKIDRDQKG